LDRYRSIGGSRTRIRTARPRRVAAGASARIFRPGADAGPDADRSPTHDPPMRIRLTHLAVAMTIITSAACAPAATRPAQPERPITDAESLVRAMHDRYEGRWYRTLIFSQKTTFSQPGSPVREETWLEYGAMPGRLRIEMGPPEQGRGAIFANDSSYSIDKGQVAGRRAQRNDLMTLAFDVYAQAPEVTLRQLREANFSLSPVRTDTWQGRPVYVVGAAAGDLRTKQFWIDAERLVFVRLLETGPGRIGKVQDVRFNNYQRLGGGWIAPEVEIVVDGQRVFHEAYSGIRHDVPLDPSLFDPSKWSEAVHPPAP